MLDRTDDIALNETTMLFSDIDTVNRAAIQKGASEPTELSRAFLFHRMLLRHLRSFLPAEPLHVTAISQRPTARSKIRPSVSSSFSCTPFTTFSSPNIITHSTTISTPSSFYLTTTIPTQTIPTHASNGALRRSRGCGCRRAARRGERGHDQRDS